MTITISRRLFRADEYEQMIRAGILTKYDRVELIEGEIVEMTPIGPRHCACVAKVAEHFILTFQKRAIVRVQSTIRADDRSMPEPDIVLARPRASFYAEAYPRPEDILLSVEVSESSKAYDRRIKGPLYAKSGIAEFWILDLAKDCLYVFRKPSPERYEQIRRFSRNRTVQVEAFPDVQFSVNDLLP